MKIKFNGIKLHNIITHKDTEFKFSKGVSIIRGENGSGKSLILNTLANVLYATPPLSTKKNNAKQMFDKDGNITIDLDNGKTNYKISQFSKGKSVAYKISQNENDLALHTITEATDKISTIFPLSAEQFYTTVYLNAYRSSAHPLLFGTGPQRKEFFINFFELQWYDYIQSALKEKYSTVKSNKLKYDSLEENIKALQSNVQDVDKKDYYELKEKSSKYNKLNLKYTQYLSTYNQYQTLYETIKEKDIKACKQNIEDLQSRIEQCESKIEKGLKIEANNEKYEEYVQQKQKLQQDIVEDDKGVNWYKDKRSQYQKEIQSLKAKIKEYDDAILKYQRWKKADENLSSKFKNGLDEAKLSYKKLLKRISLDEQIVQKANKLKDIKECPTCGSIIDTKHWKVMIQHAQQEIDKLSKYEDQDQYIDIWYNKVEKPQLDKDQLLQKIDEYETKLDKLDSKIEKVIKSEQNKQQIKNLKKYEYIQPIKYSKYQKSKKEYSEQLEYFRSNYTSLKQLQQIDIDTSKYPKINGWITKNSSKVSKLNEKVGKLKAVIQQNKSLKSNIKQVQQEKEQLDISNADLYEILIKAYSTKGIRIQQIENIANLFCNQLNLYSSLIFPEPIKFSIKVDENNFNILAERDKRIADVATLSGAQSRAFQLLCVLTLISFIPEKYRTDTVILDEMESGLSKKFREKLCNEFIPQLKTLIPKVIIITPLDKKTLWIEGSKEYMVIKKKGISKLVED